MRWSCSSAAACRRSGASRPPATFLGSKRLDARIAPIDRELRPLAASDARAQLLQTILGVGSLIGLTFAAELGDVSRS
jgi:hypothetical protein